MISDRTRVIGSLIVVVSAICFGTLGPASRLAYDQGVTALGFTAWRALLGGLLMVAVIVSGRLGGASRGSILRAPRRELRNLVIAGLAGYVLNLAIFMAYSRVPIAIALLGFYTYPAMVAVADAVILGERLDRPKLAALGLALVGMALVVGGQLIGSTGVAFDLLGFGLALLAAASQTIYITVSRHGYPSIGGARVIAFVMLFGAVAYGITAAIVGALPDLALPFRNAAAWPILLFGGFVGGGLPALLFLTGVRWIGGTRTSILALFEPVTGLLLAAILLGESLHPIQIVGGVLILAAAALLQRGPVSHRRANEPPSEDPGEPPIPALV